MPRSFKHWNARYIVDRIALAIYQKLHPDAPWITAGAIRFLDAHLKKSHRGLEWGSGRSTIWLAKRVQHLTSVEDNPAWYQSVADTLKRDQLANVNLLLRQPKNGYVDVAFGIENDALDFVLVDGDVRDECAVAALRLVKPGGLLILDNSNRYLPRHSRAPRPPPEAVGGGRWDEFTTAVGGWRMIHTTNGVEDTTIWIRPPVGSL